MPPDVGADEADEADAAADATARAPEKGRISDLADAHIVTSPDGASPDGASPVDAGPVDAGPVDAARVEDAAPIDAGPLDAATDARVGDAAPRDAGEDASTLGCPSPQVPSAVPPPRLVSPSSGTTMTTKSPRLAWHLPQGANGARVELCADRACAQVLTAFDAVGENAVVPVALPSGPVFWRAVGRDGNVVGVAASSTWELIIPKVTTAGDAHLGATLDVDGDGYADLAVPSAPLPRRNGSTPHRSLDVYLGSATGIGAVPAQTVSAPTGTSFCGTGLADAGDVNGDGFSDLVACIVGPSQDIAVVFGGPSGLSSSARVLASGASYGKVSGLGDVDRDGYADLAVVGEQASVVVFRGGPCGPDTPTWTMPLQSA